MNMGSDASTSLSISFIKHFVVRKKALLVFSFEIRCSQLFYDRLIVFSGYCIFLGMEQNTYENLSRGRIWNAPPRKKLVYLQIKIK